MRCFASSTLTSHVACGELRCAHPQVEQLRQADGSPGPWLVLDGAHTPAAAAGLAHTLRDVFPDAALAFVVAMAADKDAAGFMAELRTARPGVLVFTSAPIGGSTRR